MNTIVGIDVSKDELVIYVNGKYYTIFNNQKSLKRWVYENKKLVNSADLFVFEPTGGYERTLSNFLRV